MPKLKNLKFGDIIINHHASDNNPSKKAVFVMHKKNGIQRTDMKGNFWVTMHDDESKLEKVGTIFDGAVAGPSDNKGSEDSAALGEGQMKVKLLIADRVMQLIDRAIDENRMSARSEIADARLNYSEPHTYLFLGGES